MRTRSDLWRLRRLALASVWVGLQIAATAGHAASIDPNDPSGSFGADPVAWGNTPNTVPTSRSTPRWARPTSQAEAAATLTTHQAWDVFTVVGAGNSNAPDTPGAIPAPPRVEASPANPNGSASVFELTGTAFVTGGGNIYSPTTTISLRADVPNYGLGPGYQTHVLMQIRTQGSDLDLASFQVNGTPLAALPDYSYQSLFTATLGGPGGVLIDHKFEFTIPANNASDVFTWLPDGSSSSFDKLSIDTQAVPEPATGALAAVGVLCLAMTRTRFGGRRRP